MQAKGQISEKNLTGKVFEGDGFQIWTSDRCHFTELS